MKNLLLITLMALLLVTFVQTFPLNECPSTTSAFDISTFTFSPDPPKSGGDLVVKASGELKKPVTQGATVRVVLKYGFVTVHDETSDLCEAMKDVRYFYFSKKNNILLQWY